MDLRNHSQDLSVARKQAAGPAPSSKGVASMIRIDPKASEALASAVSGAKPGPGSMPTPEARPTPAPAAPTGSGIEASPRSRAMASILRAVAAAALIGACGVASYAGTQAHRDRLQQAEAGVAQNQAAATTLSNDALKLNQETVARLGGELDALRAELAALRAATGASSRASSSEQARLHEKVDALAAALRDFGVRSSAIEARLERMENQIMTGLAGLAGLTAKPAAAAPAAVAPTVPEAAVREPLPAVKPVRNEPVDGWVVREVYDGAALVEGRNRRLYEVAPGGIVPGVGRVEAIERRGRNWVVLTDKGFIGSYR
jgi:uncharacterized protein YukE